jgi:citrate synthase
MNQPISLLLTARQAADLLGIKLDTLYAYVSRGRLRAVEVPGTRQRRYRAAEVEALRGAGAPPRGADPEALMPVIGSSICLIEDGRFYYRGQDAVGLSASATLEDVAALLWRAETGPLPTDVGDTDFRPDVAASGLIERCQVRLASLADRDLPALDLTRPGVIRTGWRILHALAGCVTPVPTRPEPIHRRLAAAWNLDQAGGEIVRGCLVLIADHELNASTFVVASPRPAPRLTQ